MWGVGTDSLDCCARNEGAGSSPLPRLVDFVHFTTHYQSVRHRCFFLPPFVRAFLLSLSVHYSSRFMGDCSVLITLLFTILTNSFTRSICGCGGCSQDPRPRIFCRRGGRAVARCALPHWHCLVAVVAEVSLVCKKSLGNDEGYFSSKPWTLCASKRGKG